MFTDAMVARCRRCLVLLLFFTPHSISTVYRLPIFMCLLQRLDVFFYSFIFFSSPFVIYLFHSSFSASFFSRTMWCDIGRNLFDASHIGMAFTCFVAWFALKTNSKSQKFKMPHTFKETTKRKFDSRKWYVPRHLTQIPSVDLHEFMTNAFCQDHKQKQKYFDLYWVDVTFWYLASAFA